MEDASAESDQCSHNGPLSEALDPHLLRGGGGAAHWLTQCCDPQAFSLLYASVCFVESKMGYASEWVKYLPLYSILFCSTVMNLLAGEEHGIWEH